MRYQSAARQRKAGKIFRYTCGTLTCLSLLFVLGTVGAIELGDLDLGAGSIRLVLYIAAFALFGRLSGAMK